MVIIQKVVKVVSDDNQKVVTKITQFCEKRHRLSDNPVTIFGLSWCQPLVRVLLSGLLKRHRHCNNPDNPKVVNDDYFLTTR